MDQPKIERLLQIMQLLSADTSYAIEEMKKATGMSERTIYRYLRSLRDAGFSVINSPDGRYRLATLQKGVLDISQLAFFTKEEAKVINELIDNLDNNVAFKATIKRKLATIYSALPLCNYMENKRAGANITAIGKALRAKRQVVLHDYESANSGEAKDYLVEPYSFTTNYLDVWAYDLEAEMNKMFKIARIGSVEEKGEWQFEPMHAPREVDSFRMSGDGRPMDHVRLRLTLRAKDLMTEEFPVTAGEVFQVKRRWYWEGDVNRFEGIGRFVLGLHREVVVEEGKAFMEWLKGEAKSIGEEYLKGGFEKKQT